MFLLPPADDAGRAALVDGESGLRLSHAELRTRVAAAAADLSSDRKQLLFVAGDNRIPAVVGYLAAIEAGHAVAWVEPSLGGAAPDRLLDAYRPELVLLGRLGGDAPSPPDRYSLEEHALLGPAWRSRAGPPAAAIHPDLACLLSTSGSTGSRKLVRLRRQSLAANARAIVGALGLSARDVAVAWLPIAHAYGLSVVNSHLLSGGTVVLSGKGILQGDFWRLARDERVTAFPGVPLSYELLRRLGPERVVPEAVTMMTQAGGRLGLDHVRFFRDFMAARGGRLRVMYGQTEATARISVWPADVPEAKLGSVGRVIPGGALRIEPATGEILYRGPNVMMGYAECRDDLALPARVGELRTGDLGYLDDDGFLFVTGRTKRIAKVAGRRVSLDEVEALLAGRSAAAVEVDGRLAVFVERGVEPDLEAVTRQLSEQLGLDRGFIQVAAIARLPRSSAGKLAYGELETPANPQPAPGAAEDGGE